MLLVVVLSAASCGSECLGAASDALHPRWASRCKMGLIVFCEKTAEICLE